MAKNLDTYIVPRFEYNDHYGHWDAWIEERTNDETNDIVFAWHVRKCETPNEALTAVTTEYVSMCRKMIGYSLKNEG